MITLYLDTIYETFQGLPRPVLTERELEQVITEYLGKWLVPDATAVAKKMQKSRRKVLSVPSTGIRAVRDALVAQTDLQVIRLRFPYRPTTRYAWGDVPNLAIAQTLDHSGYFSHFTAMRVHLLTDQLPKTIYLNVEQQLSGGGTTNSLTQEAIDRAFSARCRVTQNRTMLRDQEIYRLNGRYTGELGVIATESGAPTIPMRVTDLERTLIDAAVRPVYSGGIFEVAQAYKEAAERVSVERMSDMLEKLDFTYPYHQAIGFYMERAGNYRESDLARMRQFGLNFNFYLDYGIRNREYRESWRLFVPKRF